MRPEYMACPIRQVISRFGDKWSLLVLYTIYSKGSGDAIRYSDVRHEMLDCSPKMLSSTLRNLEKIDLIHRELYPRGAAEGGIQPHPARLFADAVHSVAHGLGKGELRHRHIQNQVI